MAGASTEGSNLVVVSDGAEDNHPSIENITPQVSYCVFSL